MPPLRQEPGDCKSRDPKSSCPVYTLRLPAGKNEDPCLTPAFFRESEFSSPRRLEGARTISAKNVPNLTVDKIFILFFHNQHEFRSFDRLLQFIYIDAAF